jgi:hypothetical protein
MRAGVAERRSASAPTNALPLEHIREDLGDCSPVTAYSGVKPLENHMFVLSDNLVTVPKCDQSPECRIGLGFPESSSSYSLQAVTLGVSKRRCLKISTVLYTLCHA